MTAPAAVAVGTVGTEAAVGAAATFGNAALSTAASTFYRGLATLATRTAESAVTSWRRLDPEALVASWASRDVGEQLFVAVSSAQLTASAAGQPYVAAAVAAQGLEPIADSALIAKSLAGIASDGRDLEDLLFQPVLTSLRALGQGAGTQQALDMGESALRMIASTQVSDAGRSATGVAMVTERSVRGYVRMLVPPSCGRCAVLAGRVYRWSTGFERHPLCDCVMVPAAEDTTEDLRTDPRAYFNSLSATDQDRYFTVAGADAIRKGADISRVVNARRGASGLSQPGRLTAAEQKVLRGGKERGRLDRVDVYGRQVAVTTEGTTRRSDIGKRFIAEAGGAKSRGSRYQRSKTPRLMPEAIAELANGDRDEQLRLLRRFGYIT